MKVIADGNGYYGLVPGLEKNCYEQDPLHWEAALEQAKDDLRLCHLSLLFGHRPAKMRLIIIIIINYASEPKLVVVWIPLSLRRRWLCFRFWCWSLPQIQPPRIQYFTG
jgi:hypothetical protein